MADCNAMSKPGITETVQALRVIAAATGITKVRYEFEGRFRLRLAGGWSLVLSPDDAGRFRLDACYAGRVRASMWSHRHDVARLAELASAAKDEAAALAAR